jgi:hypothetical protein
MISFLARRIWTLLALLATVGGVAGIFYLPPFTGDDYALSLTLKSSEQIISGRNDVNGLTIIYNGQAVPSLHFSKFVLRNEGKRALMKEFVLSPVAVSAGAGNSILGVASTHKMLSFTKQGFTVNWELLNPGEEIDVLVYSTFPVSLSSSQRIREIAKLKYNDEVKNPPVRSRIDGPIIAIFAFAAIGLILALDGILLIRRDLHLQKLLDYVNGVPITGTTDPQLFLDDVSSLYSGYYQMAHFLFLPPDDFTEELSSAVGQTASLNGGSMVKACNAARALAMNRNLYNIRTSNLLMGPVLAIFCLLFAAYKLFA